MWYKFDKGGYGDVWYKFDKGGYGEFLTNKFWWTESPYKTVAKGKRSMLCL